MKVIDLLNKIANGEPLPNKICLECVNSINEHNCYYHFSPIFESYINDDNTLIQNATNLATLLNLEVEVIEEDKKIGHIENYVDFVNLNDSEKFDYLYEMETRIIDYINKEK